MTPNSANKPKRPTLRNNAPRASARHACSDEATPKLRAPMRSPKLRNNTYAPTNRNSGNSSRNPAATLSSGTPSSDCSGSSPKVGHSCWRSQALDYQRFSSNLRSGWFSRARWLASAATSFKASEFKHSLGVYAIAKWICVRAARVRETRLSPRRGGCVALWYEKDV